MPVMRVIQYLLLQIHGTHHFLKLGFIDLPLTFFSFSILCVILASVALSLCRNY
jgi:hypothetical protein